MSAYTTWVTRSECGFAKQAYRTNATPEMLFLAEREGFEPVHLKGLQSESKGEKIPYDPLMPPDLCTDLCTTLGSGGLHR
jgi:hypothetical protein